MRAMSSKKPTSFSMTSWNLPGTSLKRGTANTRTHTAKIMSIAETTSAEIAEGLTSQPNRLTCFSSCITASVSSSETLPERGVPPMTKASTSDMTSSAPTITRAIIVFLFTDFFTVFIFHRISGGNAASGSQKTKAPPRLLPLRRVDTATQKRLQPRQKSCRGTPLSSPARANGPCFPPFSF